MGGENGKFCHEAPPRAGLIPAWAGKTELPRRALTAPPAHPRVGGENRITRNTRVTARGSSPRGRGKHFGSGDALPALGLIPAWAGKTYSLPIWLKQVAAHPRVGGENSEAILAQIADIGSSPRGRGKRAQCDHGR